MSVANSAISLRYNLKSCHHPLRPARHNLTYWAVRICGNVPCWIRVVCLCLSTCWTRSNRTYPRAQVPTPDCHLATPATAHCCISLQHTAHSSIPSCTRLYKHFLPFNLCSSFAENPLTALEPTQQPSTEDFFTGGDKAAGLWGHHSPPSTAEIQNKWRYAATTPLRCLKPCTGGTLLRLSVRISVLLPHQLMNGM